MDHMPITIYGTKNCGTMKKARAWLGTHGADYAFRDYEIAGTAGRRVRQRRYGIPRMVAASGIMLAGGGT